MEQQQQLSIFDFSDSDKSENDGELDFPDDYVPNSVQSQDSTDDLNVNPDVYSPASSSHSKSNNDIDKLINTLESEGHSSTTRIQPGMKQVHILRVQSSSVPRIQQNHESQQNSDNGTDSKSFPSIHTFTGSTSAKEMDCMKVGIPLNKMKKLSKTHNSQGTETVFHILIEV